MSFLGRDVIDIGSTRIGQRYVFGARVPLNNPNWNGPWDCAEFASWCAYQAYGLIFGAGNVTDLSKADPYSGDWYSDANKRGTTIDWQDALKIPGAALIRAPARGKVGHVAFAVGDNDRTLEARGAAFGVNTFGNAANRSWSVGCLLPGVEYSAATAPPPVKQPPKKPSPLPIGYLWLKTPHYKGASVVALQRALKAKGIDPGPIDGEYGPMTDAAVISFQMMNGLEVDGVVGPNTAKALELAFPIVATDDDERIYKDARTPRGPSSVPLPITASGFDGIVDISQQGRDFKARAASGFSFIIGTSTTYTDDMNRVGLFQGKAAIGDSLKFGVYKPADFSAAFDQWAYFIEPTLSAEGEARFATINTYDRAAFTFGAPQLAAHTPNRNFIVYLRELLALPNADRHFPELSLHANRLGNLTVHLAQNGTLEDLEEAIEITRPNGKKEEQLVRLMKYLNPSPTNIDAAELSAAARLMNWLRLDPKAKDLQIGVFIGHAKENLAIAKSKIRLFTGDDWRVALWVMDIMHQGRGTFKEMASAIGMGTPEPSLKQIGWPRYKTRIQTISAAVDKLSQSSVMRGFKV